MGVDSRIYLLKWWITCFASVLEPHETSLLWDRLLTRGIASLVAFSLALLQHLFMAHPVSWTHAHKRVRLVLSGLACSRACLCASDVSAAEPPRGRQQPV